MAIETSTRKDPRKFASGSCENCWLSNFSNAKLTCVHPSNGTGSKQKREYSKGECLIRSGEPAKGIFCIQQGIVKVARKGKESTEFIPWIANSGDILGLSAIISDDVFTFSASAISQVSSCFVPASVLQELLVNEPEAFIQLLTRVCERLNALEDRIASLSTRKKREVLAEVLIAITTLTQSLTDGSPVNCSIKDLASLTGTSKNYMNKILADFCEKEIISVHNRKVIIQNREALLSIAKGN
jgi:CRP/FNR family transcriptional regulator